MRTRTSRNRTTPNPTTALALLALLLFAHAAAQADTGELEASSGLDEQPVANTALAGEKAATCTDNSCTGTYGEIIVLLQPFNWGKVLIEVTQPVIDAVNASVSAPCALVSGKQVSLIIDGDGGEEEILTQLYISSILNSKISLRWTADSSGSCTVGYLFALYGSP